MQNVEHHQQLTMISSDISAQGHSGRGMHKIPNVLQHPRCHCDNPVLSEQLLLLPLYCYLELLNLTTLSKALEKHRLSLKALAGALLWE